MSATSAFHGSESKPKLKVAVVLLKDKSNLDTFMPHLKAALEAAGAEYLFTPGLNRPVDLTNAWEMDTDDQIVQQVMQIMALAQGADQDGADFGEVVAARRRTQPTPTKGSAESDEAYEARAVREARVGTLQDLIAKLPAEAMKRFTEKTYFRDWRVGGGRRIETAKNRSVRQRIWADYIEAGLRPHHGTIVDSVRHGDIAGVIARLTESSVKKITANKFAMIKTLIEAATDKGPLKTVTDLDAEVSAIAKEYETTFGAPLDPEIIRGALHFYYETRGHTKFRNAIDTAAVDGNLVANGGWTKEQLTERLLLVEGRVNATNNASATMHQAIGKNAGTSERLSQNKLNCNAICPHGIRCRDELCSLQHAAGWDAKANKAEATKRAAARRTQTRTPTPTSEVVCYGCNKVGHIQRNCPDPAVQERLRQRGGDGERATQRFTTGINETEAAHSPRENEATPTCGGSYADYRSSLSRAEQMIKARTGGRSAGAQPQEEATSMACRAGTPILAACRCPFGSPTCQGEDFCMPCCDEDCIAEAGDGVVNHCITACPRDGLPSYGTDMSDRNPRAGGTRAATGPAPHGVGSAVPLQDWGPDHPVAPEQDLMRDFERYNSSGTDSDVVYYSEQDDSGSGSETDHQPMGLATDEEKCLASEAPGSGPESPLHDSEPDSPEYEDPLFECEHCSNINFGPVTTFEEGSGTPLVCFRCGEEHLAGETPPAGTAQPAPEPMEDEQASS